MKMFYYVEIIIIVYLTITKTNNGRVQNFGELNKILILVLS